MAVLRERLNSVTSKESSFITSECLLQTLCCASLALAARRYSGRVSGVLVMSIKELFWVLFCLRDL